MKTKLRHIIAKLLVDKAIRIAKRAQWDYAMYPQGTYGYARAELTNQCALLWYELAMSLI